MTQTIGAETQIGRSHPRLDAREKLCGQARFVGDLLVPRMLHGRVLRSPVAHARLGSIDTSAAEQLPGVVCVLTGADLGDLDPYFGHAIKDRPIVAIEKVRFHGEPVAAVAAETPAAAAAAVDAITVEYEDLPVLATVEDALARDAPLVNEGPSRPGLFHGLGELPARDGNVCYRYRLDRGELEAVFARADVVIEGAYTFPSVYQYAMETHTVIAQVEGDEITLWATCQHPFLVRAEIADLFGVPVANVRVIVPYLGGGFGSKSYTKMEPLTVALARKAGRPVRIQNRVGESMVTTRRHNMRCRMRTAATADGRLLARDVECEFDTGAYADNGPRVTATAGDAAPGPYRWAAYRVDAACVYTNTAPAGSYRAFGATHLQWIGESQVDEVARRAGLDPLELRRLNLLTPGEEVRAGAKPLDADLIGDVEKVADAVGWGEPKPPHVGRGVSVGLLAAGAHPVSSAVCRLEADGRVVVLVGTTELGQGPRTAFAQIAAEEIGVEPGQVVVRGTDTRFTPYDRSTGASRSTTLAGLAVQRAAASIRAKLFETAAAELSAEPGELEARAGAVWHGERSLTHIEVLRKRFGFAGGELIGEGEVAPAGTGSYAEGPVFWEVCVGAAEVEVDPDTGYVYVRATATAADVGRAINPQLVERQDEGATLQGIGNALFEEMVYEDALLLNDTLLDYRVPGFEDLPDEMTCVIVENGDGPGPYGAKGCGEGALAAVPAAIVNALADAGVQMSELPLTPERVWRRIQELKKEGAWQT
ncbi:MAG TPA: xanthine dehydrogenase family protein molybdopterin-binding subunit [Gaiellaceae bacterium]|nr:xanthine dehydrogenase family protein molybdopterin-binding subunit [Gaiellaceae bacterium]